MGRFAFWLSFLVRVQSWY